MAIEKHARGSRFVLTMAAVCGAPDLAFAQEAVETDLQRRLQEQATRIEQLEARLQALERPSAPPQGADEALAKRLDSLEQNQRKTPQVSWSRGLPQLTSADGKSTFRPRGRLLLDASSTGGSDYAARQLSGSEVRSVRLGIEGTHGPIGWVLEGDFANNKVAWKSAYVSYQHVLLGKPAELTVGNRLNDRGLDGSSGTINTPFQDRNTVGTTLLPQRGAFGVGLTERWFGQDWHASVSMAGNDLNSSNGNDSVALAARAHWNPLKSEAATMHLGAWSFAEHIAKGATGALRSASIGGHFNQQVKVLPGVMPEPRESLAYGLEWAMFSGPFWSSAEWGRRELRSRATLPGSDHRQHEAYAVSAGWFLAGGSPAYLSRSGTWGRVKVAQPVGAGGAGAWELKLRYEAADYTDLLQGGKGDAFTFGANWYWNDFSRVMLDVVRWSTRSRTGAYQGPDDGYTVNARFQVAF